MIQYAIAGRTRRMTLGSTSVLDPGKARETAKDLLAKVRLGGDPAGEKVEARARAGETVGALMPRFLERQRARLKPRSWQEVNRHLSMHAKALHGYPITTIERRTIATRLAEIEKASGPAACNRARTSLSAFFSWAAREGYIDANPAAFTNKAIENGSRERVLADDELVSIWQGVGGDQYGAIVKLLMLTGARRTEIGGLELDEFDLDDALITLPPERTKNGREHLIPLSEPALEILKALPRRTMDDGTPWEHVFGANAGCGYQNYSRAKAELDARIAKAGHKLAPWTLHDFRRSISTALHDRFGVPPHVVEVILGHAGGHKGGTPGRYNKASYLTERKRALERWGAHITALVTGKPVEGGVVRLRRAISEG